MPIKEWTQECKACKGTGLYVGMGERDGAAIVCHVCDGTGEQRMRFEYEEFGGRKPRPEATWVYAVNPGIVADNGLVVSGGVPKADWESNPLFPWRVGVEMREHTCPRWWYQSANYGLKPEWDECDGRRGFATCPHFGNKAECWHRWDAEYVGLVFTKPKKGG